MYTHVILPSTIPNPNVIFLDNIRAARETTVVVNTQGHDAVVIVHFFGGRVGNSAIQGLTRQPGELFA